MMKTLTGLALPFALLVMASTGLAQDAEEQAERAEIEQEEQARIEEEQARVEEELALEVELLTQEAMRVAAGGGADTRAAESRLAEAARRVAELSTRNLPFVAAGSWTSEISGRPVLGVSIDAEETDQPVEGVEILGVSPGGPADEAGLRAGDVMTSVNGESLTGDSVGEANGKLLDFMAGVEDGDEVEIEYLRAGRTATVVVSPRATPHVFSFSGNGRDFTFPMPPAAPGAPRPPGEQFSRYIFITEDGIGDMEMVSLTEGLGRYFGTDEGLLVVRAPEDADTYKLQDGDVILNIDGREPRSVSHALRILGSYQSGEKLSIRIMRDKRERTLEIEIPDRRTGALGGLPDVHVDSDIEVSPTIRVAPRVIIRSDDDSA